MLDLGLFKDRIFILFVISNFLTSIGFNVPYVYTVVSKNTVWKIRFFLSDRFCLKKIKKIRKIVGWQNFLFATMLQKLSKCEIKATRFVNFTICSPRRFFVKSNFDKFKQSKNVIFGNFGGSEIFVFQFEPCFKSQIYTNSIFRVSEIVKMAIFNFRIMPKLISDQIEWQTNF